MSIANIMFMQRVKYLESDRQSFLLDTMEKARQDFLILFPRHRKRFPPDLLMKNKNDWQESLWIGVVTLWSLLDDPQIPSLIQIEQRLKEMKNQKSGQLIKQNLQEDDNSFEQLIPNHKKEEYEKILAKYVSLPDSDRQFFLNVVKGPIAQQRMACCPMLEYQKEQSRF